MKNQLLISLLILTFISCNKKLDPFIEKLNLSNSRARNVEEGYLPNQIISNYLIDTSLSNIKTTIPVNSSITIKKESDFVILESENYPSEFIKNLRLNRPPNSTSIKAIIGNATNEEREVIGMSVVNDKNMVEYVTMTIPAIIIINNKQDEIAVYRKMNNQ